MDFKVEFQDGTENIVDIPPNLNRKLGMKVRKIIDNDVTYQDGKAKLEMDNPITKLTRMGENIANEYLDSKVESPEEISIDTLTRLTRKYWEQIQGQIGKKNKEQN